MKRIPSVAAVFAVLMISSAVLFGTPPARAAVSLPVGSIPVPASGTFLYMYSEPGDYIGGQVEQLYTSEDSSIQGSLPVGSSLFSASIIQGQFVNWWYVQLAAPQGEPLVVGSYEGAVRWPFNPAGIPGLSVSGNGRGCNTLSGEFDINQLSYAVTGELLLFDATFEQHCEGGPSALFGRIRIENPPPPPDVTAPTLVVPQAVDVESPDTAGVNVSYYAYATDERDPAPIVTCSPNSGSFFVVGATTVTCQATDASGNLAVGSFVVTVYAPLQVSLRAASVGSVSKTGTATISGTIDCSRALSVQVTGTLTQLFANRVLVTGTFSEQVECVAPTTAWTLEVPAQNGKFGAGMASLSVNGDGCELSCHHVEAASSVRLNAKR